MALPTTTVRKGSRGTEVVTLQQRMNTHLGLQGQSALVADGNFGSLTASAVTTFQARNGLSADGIAGKNTWSKIAELDTGGGTIGTYPTAPVTALPGAGGGETGGGDDTPEAPAASPTPSLKPRATVFFRRTGATSDQGAVMGEMTLDGTTWATVERGGGYTFVRKGTYFVTMDRKNTGRTVQCLRFDEDWSIATHLVHDALNDNHKNLEGCIAPGTQADGNNGITGSDAAMQEFMAALGGYAKGATVKFIVENNISGGEDKDAWIRRRQRERS